MMVFKCLPFYESVCQLSHFASNYFSNYNSYTLEKVCEMQTKIKLFY